MDQKDRQLFVDMLAAEYSITELHGLDLMRQIKILSHLYGMLMSSLLRDAQLSSPRWRLLLHLHVAEYVGKTSLSPTELSQLQVVTKNTISSLLRSLEDHGLIERTLDPNDRRQFQIGLTAEGRDLIRTSTPEHMAYLNQLASGLSSDEINHLQELLHKLHRSLVEYGDLSDVYDLG
jgi:DNA-binding MarR family transcriptional regulator